MTEEETQRVEQINQIANGFGQTLLTICRGDWDLALSVSLTLFASTCAQAAIENSDDVGELFDSMGEPARAATLAFHSSFVEGDDAE